MTATRRREEKPAAKKQPSKQRAPSLSLSLKASLWFSHFLLPCGISISLSELFVFTISSSSQIRLLIDLLTVWPSLSLYIYMFLSLNNFINLQSETLIFHLCPPIIRSFDEISNFFYQQSYLPAPLVQIFGIY